MLAALKRHRWPGNIRELRAVIERACIRSTGRRLTPGDFDLAAGPSPAPQFDDPGRVNPRPRTLREVECEHVKAMLAFSGGIIEGRNGAAAVLGLSPSTLRFRIRRLGIQAAEFRNPAGVRAI